MAKKKSTTVVPALQFLMSPGLQQLGAICAIAGDDAFLRHEVRKTLAGTIGDAGDADLDIEILDGKLVEFRDVVDGLRERSLFGSERRVILVEEADAFVKHYRERLEQYLEKPAEDAVLVLEVKTWPANTRLAKAVAKIGLTIRCQVPQQGRELTEFTKPAEGLVGACGADSR